MSLSGKVAVVTGAAAGIGKAFCEILHKNSATVVLLDVNESAGESLMDSLNEDGQNRALFLTCDVTSEQQLKGVFKIIAENFGGIDILCNNAGIVDEKNWEQTVDINLLGVIKGTYAALEHMSKLNGGRGGVIVNTASMAGIKPLISCPVYSATKSAVIGFSRAMAGASTMAGYGIRFNALCPALVQTELLTSLTDKLGQFTHLGETTRKLLEKHGVLSASEVAECLLELVTDESKNGEALMISFRGKMYTTFPSIEMEPK
ncbi:15-hydroxyprostaglandin dehydrogenase [NAD(+)]-like [Corythoichthys intestinalis]|uniref:15-hydroxyprostaglandin dehydrogenase [NAD(+)]-like n=1 Tax=Corythoichthys intestinalis TaxID=161448 RepID=UPI0025A64071|nr:15-hydroxyprostaglandin dehydrogenase [NAD(+)]-like [Corythoichthys intestinalis]XP_061801589.1 15-hydroxyprostaglandin dehydrogenase [NAD(+)]-like [Nerophis lumbriciformis]